MIDSLTDLNNFRISDDAKQLHLSLDKYIVDPEGVFYKNSKINFEKSLEKVMGNKVAAIDSEGGVNYKNKGLEYDSYLTSFILGSGGKISNWDIEESTDSALVIRGLGGGSRKALRHCWNTGRTYYAIDTGYLGNDKKKLWHRVTKNNLQNLGPIIDRPGDRLKRLDWKFKKFSSGRHILICPPSDKVMDLWNQPDPKTWTEMVITELKKYTDRPVKVRLKPLRSERVTTQTIEMALDEDIYCLITYNSIAATEALLYGKPAIALGPNAAQVLCNNKLSQVEDLHIPSRDEMDAFVRHLSYCQFTVSEMQDGTAWRIVNESS